MQDQSPQPPPGPPPLPQAQPLPGQPSPKVLPLPEQPLSPEALVGSLLRMLDLEEVDIDLYRGFCQPGGRGRVFGGQVIAQSLIAAMRSVSNGGVAHSLHAYFMRPGNEDYPIVYRVMRDFDGRSFATRRIVAMQRGQPILNMAASFQKPERGIVHQARMPDVPPPEELISEADAFRLQREQAGLPPHPFETPVFARPIEARAVDPRSLALPQKRPPYYTSWLRAVAPVGDDPDIHRAILAYASDMSLLGTCMMPHGLSWMTPGVQTASLDHALWLHDDFRVDDWLLYVTDSPWAGGARGFNRGQVFSRDGRLVASVAQEGLVRQK